MLHAQRRHPIGAEVIGKDETHFRLWALKAREIDVVLEDGTSSEPIFYPLTPEAGGYFSGAVNVGAGSRYRFRANRGENFIPIRHRAFSHKPFLTLFNPDTSAVVSAGHVCA